MRRVWPPRSSRTPGRVAVKLFADASGERNRVRLVLAIIEIEGVVEIFRIATLVVLQDGLEFVERASRSRFVRTRAVVVVPILKKTFLQAGWQGGDQRRKVRALTVRFGLRGILLRSGDVAIHRFPQVVQDADSQEPKQIDFGHQVCERNGKQAEPPRVLGDTFDATGRCVSAA